MNSSRRASIFCDLFCICTVGRLSVLPYEYCTRSRDDIDCDVTKARLTMRACGDTRVAHEMKTGSDTSCCKNAQGCLRKGAQGWRRAHLVNRLSDLRSQGVDRSQVGAQLIESVQCRMHE